jgi:hypothetical protein
MPRKRQDEEQSPLRVGSFCSHCDNPTSFYLYKLAEYRRKGEPAFFHFGTCELCGGPAIFLRTDGDADPEPSFLKAFPVHKNSVTFELPSLARQSYAEALRCEEAKAWLACVVMVGRTLEAVCKEHFPNDKAASIFKGIEKLYQQGIISEQLKAWADELRILRNVGAHASETVVSETDAKEAIDFLKAILENLYDLSPKFEAFKSRRNT